jgi:hypothetical protein
MLDVVSAMNDPNLFGPWFMGRSWNGWRAVLKAAFRLPMSKAERSFFRSVAERDPPKKQVRECWIVAGRRAGKDSVASVIVAHAAALFDRRDRLRRGERALCMALACDRDQAKIMLGYARSYFSEIPMLSAMVTRETSTGFELDNGVDVAIGTNNFRSVRGRALLCVVLDEVSFWRAENSTTPDEETYRALKPGMAKMQPDAMLIGISTPYRKSGLLYKKFQDHYGKNSSDVLVIRAPSTVLNPTLDRSVIDSAMDDDPVAAAAEWMAEFRDDIAAFVGRDLLEAAVDRGVSVRPPQRGIFYQSFCDPSGGARDSFTAAVAHNEKGVVVLDALVEIKPPFNPDSATAEIAAVLKSYGIRKTTADRYAAQWPVAAFARNGITVSHSERDRSEIYLDALPLFAAGRARLVDNARLVAQFSGLERRTFPTGKDRVDHGRAGHDDLCNAAAGALVLATKPSGSLKYRKA